VPPRFLQTTPRCSPAAKSRPCTRAPRACGAATAAACCLTRAAPRQSLPRATSASGRGAASRCFPPMVCTWSAAPALPLPAYSVSEIITVLIQVTVSDDRLRMRLSFTSTGEAALQLGPFSDALHSFKFSDDGLLLLLCCADRSCHIFCARSAVLFLSVPSPSAAQRSSMASTLMPTHASFSPDCRQIVLLSAGSCSVHLHSLQTSCLQTPYAVNEM
jgi:hypothetical protein